MAIRASVPLASSVLLVLGFDNIVITCVGKELENTEEGLLRAQGAARGTLDPGQKRAPGLQSSVLGSSL